MFLPSSLAELAVETSQTFHAHTPKREIHPNEQNLRGRVFVGGGRSHSIDRSQ